MKKIRTALYTGVMAIMITFALILTLAACSGAVSPSTGQSSPIQNGPSVAAATTAVNQPTPGQSQPPISTTSAENQNWYRQKLGAGATLFGMMTMSTANQTVEYPTDFTVPAISLTWTGNNFDGQREEAGTGEDVLDQVHGSISADGKLMDSFTFSRLITRISTNNGTSFKVVLKNVPLSSQAVGNPSFPGFEGGGPVIQQYIVSIEYSEGNLEGTRIIPTTSYLSTDWNNTRTGEIPRLKITFKDQGENLIKTGG